ncbi:MAG TPA: AAA family ATPase [Bacteroidales bacterium]|nr:AAA family ATPase [Bacteroidales bacterium]
MKIKTIEIKNYKAFYGEHEFNVDGKNLFVYGENGSGKSSLYYALKDFFQSSVETINFSDVENVFLTQRQKGKGYVKVIFNPDKDGNDNDVLNEFKSNGNNTYGNIQIRDAIGLKSFLTYKHLLGIHHIKHDDQIDLFGLLVKGVLKHFKSSVITGTKELGELWDDVEKAAAKPLEGRSYNRPQKKKDVETALGTFNTAFGKLFQDSNPDNIHKFAQPILDRFGHNIEFKLRYTQATHDDSPELDSIIRNHVRISIKYLNKEVEKPHVFLNEARLSAIAISIYLGMIKRHTQGRPLKVLFLDDIFIGLDIANRLPLIEVLKSEFGAYQIFITTYDKPWYEFMKFYLDKDNNWKCLELYARRARKGFEVPVKVEHKTDSHIQNFIDKTEDYFNNGDNKAAGVYLRSAFEFILKKTCKKRSIPVAFRISVSELTTEHLWTGLKKYEDNLVPSKKKLTTGTINDIEHYRKLVLNPLSHHDVNKHEITAEIQNAIATIKTLKNELGV